MDLLSQTMQERARAKIERALSFSGGTSTDMDGLVLQKKMRTPRDQMSHRIIEKRRRDRMNNCLANLGQLIPVNYLKQGQGRIEKTEIIEMATQHITELQTQVQAMSSMERPCCQEKFLMGYKECRDEVMRFLVEMAGYEAADPFCLTLLKHLHKQSKKFVPESASSVYQASHSPHHGSNTEYFGNNTEFTMPQNAGEIGGMMHHSETNMEDQPDPGYTSSMSTSTSRPSTSWTSHAPQKNMFTDINQFLNAPLHSSASPLCSDSGYSTTASGVASQKQQQKQQQQQAPSKSPMTPSTPEKAPVHSAPPPPAPSPTLSPNQMTSTDSCDSSSVAGGMNSRSAYKFKNDIKQRFSGHSSGSNSSSSGGGSSGDKPESDTSQESTPQARPLIKDHAKKTADCQFPNKCSPFCECSTVYSSSNSQSNSETWTMQHPCKKRKVTTPAASCTASSSSDNKPESIEPSSNNQVPAFALHPLGTCYIPLVIPRQVVESFLNSNSSPSGMCHPVSIPVNFNRPEPVVVFAKQESEATSCAASDEKMDTMTTAPTFSSPAMKSNRGSDPTDKEAKSAKQ